MKHYPSTWNLAIHAPQSAVQPVVQPAVRLRGSDEIVERVYAANGSKHCHSFEAGATLPNGTGFFLRPERLISKTITRAFCIDSNKGLSCMYSTCKRIRFYLETFLFCN
jgi:hypothetical protein